MRSPGALVAAVLFLSGCPFPLDLWGADECAQVNCAACLTSAFLEVTDAATGGAVAGVSVTGGTLRTAGGIPGWTCDPLAASTRCSTFPQQLEPVPFDAVVSAPGYAPATVRLVPATQASGGCCPSCLAFPSVQVRLTAR